MKILYYDCCVGISGDMNLGALLDLGVDSGFLIRELSKLKLDHEFEIVIKKDVKMGITGTKVDVLLTTDNHEHIHNCDNDQRLIHAQDHHHHGNNYDHIFAHDDSHRRNLAIIEDIINTSDLAPNIKHLSKEIFRQVAKAEAKVHGKPINEVHFHEVGAIDSIVDIVGAAICIEQLQVDKIMSSSVQVGGGYIKCAHGLLPVPAPATAEILKNIPIKSGIVQFETTTPTGAAILAANVDEFTDTFNFIIEKIGYGLGTRDLEIPNILRVYICSEKTEEKSLNSDRQYQEIIYKEADSVMEDKINAHR